MASQDVQPNRGGAPLGNQNRLIHGRRSRAFIQHRRQRAAMLKACALVMHRLGMFSGRCRSRPIRPDQWQYLPSEWRELC